jgi:DNA-binding response OmpR family regulator
MVVIRRILIVDEDADAANSLALLLSYHEFDMSVCHYSTDVLSCLESSNCDAIIMDIAMSIVDGLEVARTIRSDQRYSQLRLIAYTACANEDMRDSALAAGFNDYVLKPVRIIDMLNIISVGQLPERLRIHARI